MAQRATIERALKERQFVRFTSGFEGGFVRGYVLSVGPRFFLLASVSDNIRFNGFECLRIADVRNFRPDPTARFVTAALQMRSEQRPRRPSVSVASIEEILKSASRLFPLVTIHRERKKPDICYVGRVTGISHGHVALLQINTDATWETTPSSIRLSEITRVDFGGDYEEALHTVGGEPPSVRDGG